MTARCVRFLLLISLLPPPFQVALDQMFTSNAYPGRTVPIFIYFGQPIYVGFSKTGSDITIEANFDERTASDQTWKKFQFFHRPIL